MSENQSSQASASTGPACEGEVLIIEVIGKQHPEGQTFRLFDTTNRVQQEWLENQVKTEELDDSILHVWPMKGEDDKNVWLEMAADEGAPIRVPFLQEEGAVERQHERQQHVILPVVPTTLVTGVTLKGRNPASQVMCRSGFLYLLHEGKLWREIEVRISGQGKTTYHDVPLSQHRRKDGFESGPRKATGRALSEIWLPARSEGKWLDIEVAFSESQLPSARLNYFEKQSGNRTNRFNVVHLELKATTSDDGQLPGHAFPVDELKPQRSRKPADEWQFDQPGKYLGDVNGEYPSSSWDYAKRIHQRQESQEPKDTLYDDERPEINALSLCLQKTLKEVQGDSQQTSGSDEDPDQDDLEQVNRSEPPFSSELWESGGQCVPDALQDARERGIATIAVDDSIYRLRYLLQRRMAAVWFAGAASRRAMCRPYFHSGFLVNTAIVPEDFDGRENPLHKFISELSANGRSELDRSIAKSERALAQRYLKNLQSDMLSSLESEKTQAALADLFTYDGVDYLGAFQFVAEILQDVATAPGEEDALALNSGNTEDNEGKQWVRALCLGEQCPELRGMLFPEASVETLQSDYVAPGEPEENDGSGVYRGTELAKLETAGLPKVEDITSFHGLELVAAAHQGAFRTLLDYYIRFGSSMLMEVHGKLWSAIQKAEKKLAEEPAIKQQKKDIAQLKSQLESLRKERQEFVEQRVAVEEDFRGATEIQKAKASELDARQRQLNAALLDANDQLATLRSQAIRAKMKLYAGSLEGMRASMPQNWGKMKLARLSKANQKGYLVIGMLENLSSESAGDTSIRVFGDIHLESGQSAPASQMVASTNRQRAAVQGIAANTSEEALLLVLPDNENMAKALNELAEAETAIVLAQRGVASAEKAAESASQASTALAQRLQEARKNYAAAENRFAALNKRLESQKQSFESARYQWELEAAGARQTISETKGKWSYRALNSPVLPAFVMMVEAYNVSANVAAFESMKEQRGRGRATVGVISAVYDATLAVAILAERFQNALPKRLLYVGRGISAMSGFLSREIGGTVGRVLTSIAGGPVAFRALFGVAGAFVTGFLFVTDAIYQFETGNIGAGVGSSMLAAGTFAMGLSGLLASGSTLLFLGPVAWLAIGIFLCVAGAVTVWWFSEDPFETWMRHGPFGDLSDKTYLKEPGEAYYRLVSLLMGVNITLEPNLFSSKVGVGNGGSDCETPEVVEAKQRANTCLRIESPIPQLFENQGPLVIESHLRMVEMRSPANLGPGMVKLWRIFPLDIPRTRESILYSEPTDNGYLFYLDAPRVHMEEQKGLFGNVVSREVVKYSWSARVQIRIGKKDDPMVFPAPLPDSSLTYDRNNEEHTKPDFSETDRVFWFDEKVVQRG